MPTDESAAAHQTFMAVAAICFCEPPVAVVVALAAHAAAVVLIGKFRKVYNCKASLGREKRWFFLSFR